MPSHLPLDGPTSLGDRLQDSLESAQNLAEEALLRFKEQKLWKQIAICISIILCLIFLILSLIYHKKILGLAVASSNGWREMTGGKLLMFLLIFLVSFPPLIGFSALCTLTGMIWGFPNGWLILASASITGSCCSFLLFRYVLKERAKQLMEVSKTFELFTLVLNEKNALWLLSAIRLCPLPYSLSNGALAAIPGISVPVFVGASLVTSPKLFIPVFIGSKLQNMGESKSTGETIIDFLSIAITALAVSATTLILYRKMQEKLAAIDNGLNVSLDDEGNFEIDDENFLRDEEFEEDNLVV